MAMYGFVLHLMNEGMKYRVGWYASRHMIVGSQVIVLLGMFRYCLGDCSEDVGWMRE